MLTFIGGALALSPSWLLTVVIPPMPLYKEFYKTANHDGTFFSKLRWCMMASFASCRSWNHSGFWPALKASRMETDRGPAMREQFLSRHAKKQEAASSELQAYS